MATSKITDPTRLYALLLNTGLQQKDNALYQVIYQLIGQLLKLTQNANTSSSSSSSIVNQNIIIQQLLDSGSSVLGLDDNISIPGPIGLQGLTGLQGPVGFNGDNGEDGSPGPPGIRGQDGIAGTSGQSGPPGFGIDGEDGDCFIALPGPQGNPGIAGAAGPAGVTLFPTDGIDGDEGIPGVAFLSNLPLISRGGIASDVINFVVAESIVASVSLQIRPGDTIRYELFGNITNTTGGNRNYTLGIGISGVAGASFSGGLVATASNIPVHIIGYMGCHSTSLIYVSAMGETAPIGAAGTAITGVPRAVWNTQAIDITGIQTCSITVHSDAAGNGSTLHVAGFSIQKINVP